MIEKQLELTARLHFGRVVQGLHAYDRAVIGYHPDADGMASAATFIKVFIRGRLGSSPLTHPTEALLQGKWGIYGRLVLKSLF